MRDLGRGVREGSGKANGRAVARAVWALIFLGDGIAGLAALTPGCVDLVLSDLPSGVTEAEFDHAPDLAALFAATWHALKPDGIAVFMASHLPFAAACMAAGGKAYRYDLIWEKSLATGFLNAKHRPLRAHEFCLVFYSGATFFAPQMEETGVPIHKNNGRKTAGENYNKQELSTKARAGATDRFPRSVLHFGSLGQTDPLRIHPQQKPVDLLRWLVRSYSRPGEIVVDPFAGSGSSLVAAKAEGRKAVGWDTSPRFAPRTSLPEASK